MAAPADLSKLAATVAHELVTPLAIISSGASLLERSSGGDRPTGEQAQILATIRRNVALAQVVVEGLRTLDGDGADLPVDLRPVELVDLVRTTVDDLATTLLRHHPCGIETDEEEITGRADPVRIQQVLFNLLSNAAKFSPEGRRITVQLARDGDVARICVRDDGQGVAPDDAERIFRKWERGDEDAAGLGVGLHLSRAVARAHGGDLRLVPAPAGEGARFVLTVPLATGA